LFDSDFAECLEEIGFYSSSLFVVGAAICRLTLSSSSCTESSLGSTSMSLESCCSSVWLTL
jgi:hypothetical protein